jgi:hypothetical protein
MNLKLVCNYFSKLCLGSVGILCILTAADFDWCCDLELILRIWLSLLGFSQIILAIISSIEPLRNLVINAFSVDFFNCVVIFSIIFNFLLFVIGMFIMIDSEFTECESCGDIITMSKVGVLSELIFFILASCLAENSKKKKLY